MTGPWTADNQPQTKSARTWWIVGGVILAALVVFAAFLAGLGWDEATAQEEEPTGPSIAEISAGLEACDNHDRLCHANNKLDVDRLDTAMGADAPTDLRAGVTDFNTQFDSFIGSNCGTNKQNVVCGLKGLNMNLAITSIKTAVAAA